MVKAFGGLTMFPWYLKANYKETSIFDMMPKPISSLGRHIRWSSHIYTSLSIKFEEAAAQGLSI